MPDDFEAAAVIVERSTKVRAIARRGPGRRLRLLHLADVVDQTLGLGVLSGVRTRLKQHLDRGGRPTAVVATSATAVS